MDIIGKLEVYDMTYENLKFIKDMDKIKTIVELALENGYACSFDFEEVIND